MADIEAKVSDEQAAFHAAEASKKAAGHQASEQATTANSRVQTSKDTLGAIQSQLKRDLAAIAAAHRAQSDVVRAERTAALNKLTRELADAEKDKHYSIKELSEERDKALAKDGVDTEALQKLERDLQSVTEDISEGGLWAERVAGWHLWCKNEWTRLGQLAADEAEHKKQAGRVVNAGMKGSHVAV